MAEKRKTEFKNKTEESLPVAPKKKFKSDAQKKNEQELKKTEESAKNTRPLSQFFQIKPGKHLITSS